MITALLTAVCFGGSAAAIILAGRQTDRLMRRMAAGQSKDFGDGGALHSRPALSGAGFSCVVGGKQKRSARRRPLSVSAPTQSTLDLGRLLLASGALR